MLFTHQPDTLAHRWTHKPNQIRQTFKPFLTAINTGSGPRSYSCTADESNYAGNNMVLFSWFSVFQEKMMPYHRCRYKTSLYLPYVQYKEEIISLVPYASLFYDMIHDAEIEELKAMTSRKVR